MTARQILRFAASFFFTGPKVAIDDRIEEMLELVGLSDKADRPTKGFSGGEWQRLGNAQAQINYPDLLILDEPGAALDPMGSPGNRCLQRSSGGGSAHLWGISSHD
jgi:ABC-2 type transport system ATP-binding protein